MNSRRKKIALLLAVPAGLACVGVGAAAWHYTRPEVQRALALDALWRSGWTGDIGRVSLGLNGAFDAGNLSLTDAAGRRYTAPSITGEISLFGLLCGAVRIGSLDAEGLVLDLSRTADAASKNASGSAAPEPGEPPSVRIDRAHLAGKVLLPGRAVGFDVSLRDADTATGGGLVFEAHPEGLPSFTGEARLKLAAPVRGGETLPAFLDRARPELSVDAEVRPKAGAGAVATLSLETRGATATLVAKSGASRLDLRLSPGASGTLGYTGKLALEHGAFTPWTSETPPPFTAKGAFDGTFDSATGATKLALNASGYAEKSPLGPTGPRLFEADAAIDGAGGVWNIRKLHTKIGSVAAPDAVVADIGNLTVRTAGALALAGDESVSARVKLAGFPASWLAVATGDAFAFDEGRLDGTLALRREASGALRVASEDLRATGVKWSRPGAPALAPLDAVLPVSVTTTPEGDLEAKGTGVSLALAGRRFAGGGFAWRSTSAGAADLELDADLAPAVLPDGFIPGGVVEFCTRTGMTLAAKLRLNRPAAGAFVAKTASIEAVTNDGRRVLEVSLPRPLDFANLPADGRPLAKFSFKGAPLGLFNPLLGGPVIAGVAAKGDLDLSKTGSGWRVARTPGGEPASILGLSWTRADGSALLTPTDASGSPSWENSGDGWRLSLADMRFANGDGAALSGRIAFAWRGGVTGMETDISGDFGALRRSLPDIIPAALAAGNFTAKASHATPARFLLEASIRDLKTAPDGPAVSATLRSETTVDGATTAVRAPFVFAGPSGTTRATLDGGFTLKNGVRDWNLALTGDTLRVDDWIAAFSAPRTSSPGASGTKPVATPATPDAAPFWSGETGTLRIAFANIEAGGVALGKSTLALEATPDRIRTTTLATSWRDIPVSGDAALVFRKNTATSYGLSASVGATKVPLGRLAAEATPAARGVLEGDFDVALKGSGTAARSADIARSVEWRVDLTSHAGTLRFFAADNEAVRISGEIAGIAGDIAGDLGRIITPKAPVVGRTLSSFSLLRTALGAIRYDKFAVSAKREANGAIAIEAAELSNDSLRLRAKGRFGEDDGSGFASRHATVDATIEGRGALGAALTAIAPTAKAADPDWTPGPALRFDGPMRDLQANFFDNLFKSVASPARTTPTAPVRDRPEDAVRTLENALRGLGI